VDVAGGHDQVDPGLARSVADLGDHPVPLAAAGVNTPYPDRHRLPRRGPGGGRVAALGQPEADAAGGRLLGERRQVVGLAAAQRVPDRQGDAVGQPALIVQVRPDHVGEPVDPRGAVGVGALEAGQPERGPLDRHGGVPLGQPHDRAADLPGQRPGATDLGGIEA
jgi:hypothetical protein